MGGDFGFSKEMAAENKKIADGKALALSRDPWRVLDGKIVQPSEQWDYFLGDVLEVQKSGIRIDGRYTGFDGTPGYTGEFFVANFPYQTAEGDKIDMSSFYLAKPAGVFTYVTTAGGSRTIHKLDYGTIYVPPPLTPEQIEAARKLAAAKKIAAAKRAKAGAELALKSNPDAAATGDAYGLLRMGERYRDGDGVERDLTQAREYLTKAKAAGSASAGDELDALPDQK